MSLTNGGRKWDVAVVGAGLSGLSAARELRRAGLAVLLLEASDRPGGRVKNQTIADGVPVEAGGAFVGPTQTELLKLIEELGLSTFRTHHEGRDLIRRRGRLRSYKGKVMPLGFFGGADVFMATARLERLAKRLPREAPWTAPNAAELDRQSLGDWLRRHTRTQASEFLFGFLTGTHFSCRPEQLSLLAYLAHLNSAGGIAALGGFEGAAQERRIVGGSGLIAERCAGELGSELRLNEPVDAIHQHSDHIELRAAGNDLVARAVVVAIDPATCRKIEFSPPLPPQRQQLHDSWSMGTGIKFHVAFPEPFWRHESLSGISFSDEGAVRITLDMSPPDAEVGVLMGFHGAGLCGADAILGDAERRREAIVADLARLFGPGASDPLDYVEQDWSAEPHLAGCVPSCPPGLLTEAGDALRAPAGGIHWAGAESSPIWEAHMDGAIRSGKRAAAGVLDASGEERSPAPDAMPA